MTGNHSGEEARNTTPGLFFVLGVDILAVLQYLGDMKKDDFDYTRLLKYHGKFGELRKRGFKFCKVFARNYMMWFDAGPEIHDDNEIRVWKHLGGYVEINGLNMSLTKPIAKIICSPDLLESFARTSQMFPGWKVYDFLIHNETLEVVKYNCHLHDSVFVFRDRLDDESAEAEIKEWHENFQLKHRRFTLAGDSWIIHRIREMYEEGLIDPFQ